MKKTAYQQFADDFKKTVVSEDFTNNKIKIFQLQTGCGKSFFQDKEMPVILKEAFPDLKYIIRLSPTNEVANDGTFENVKELSNSEYKFRYLDNPVSSVLDVTEDNDDVVYCISCTHTYYTVNFDRLVKYAKKSVLCIEEAHQFTGCGDEGPEAYIINFGYHSEYSAETIRRIMRWREENPRILGFTATPTQHHKGDKYLSPMFQVCSDLAKLEVILSSQAWINNTKEYPYVKNNGKYCIQSSVEESVDILFDREAKLKELAINDHNIVPKLSGLFIAGDQRGIWGCPIDEVKSVISNYLLSIGYSENEKMIATMVEDSSGGIRIHDLNGGYERVSTPAELFKRLQDPQDQVRFLIVINRGRSGINLHNLTTCVVCRIRDPKEVRTQIPIQIFGRMVRINVGTGSLIRSEYQNNMSKYLLNYSKDYDVNLETVVETIKVANIFDIWYPENPKVKRTWKDSLEEFKKLYVNSVLVGYQYLYDVTKLDQPISFNQKELSCPHCNKSIEKQIQNWAFDGTLERFFV